MTRTKPATQHATVPPVIADELDAYQLIRLSLALALRAAARGQS